MVVLPPPFLHSRLPWGLKLGNHALRNYLLYAVGSSHPADNFCKLYFVERADTSSAFNLKGGIDPCENLTPPKYEARLVHCNHVPPSETAILA